VPFRPLLGVVLLGPKHSGLRRNPNEFIGHLVPSVRSDRDFG
jgi:hypothetical protein